MKMRKSLAGRTAASLLIASALFVSCVDEEEEEGLIEATETKTESISSSNIFEVAPETKTLKITGDLGGKKLYVARVNMGDYTISKSDVRAVTKAEPSSASISLSSSVSARAGADAEIDLSAIDLGKKQKYRHFVSPKFDIPVSSSRSAVSPNFSVTPISRAVGTTKDIWIEIEKRYEKKQATLRAKGTYCNVWIPDDYYASTASGNKTDESTAQTFAQKFDEMYPVIRNVFGDEAEIIRVTDGKTLTDTEITDSSDTGSTVNIVLYDIDGDYKDDENFSEGTAGFFFSKDYYKTTKSLSGDNEVLNYSNAGKYFYIDSAIARLYPNDAISTLAHEFQHMINFNMKDIKLGKVPDTSYNEMLSMLCEDMMQDFLEIDDDDSPKNRTQQFNAYYILSGIREYLENDNAVVSYATSYTFGAFLARNYGGAALIKEISQNDNTDNNSIVAAVNKINSTSLTFDKIFQKFLLALTGNETYTLNKNAKQTLSSGSYSYPMTAYDIFANGYAPEIEKLPSNLPSLVASSELGYDGNGPVLFKNNAAIDLRPQYGISLHTLGELSAGMNDLTLTFSDKGSADLYMYVIVQ